MLLLKANFALNKKREAHSIPRPGVMSGLSLLFVGSLLCSERFSPGTPVFPSTQKRTFPNSNSTLEGTDISERVLVNSLLFRG